MDHQEAIILVAAAFFGFGSIWYMTGQSFLAKLSSSQLCLAGCMTLLLRQEQALSNNELGSFLWFAALIELTIATVSWKLIRTQKLLHRHLRLDKLRVLRG